MKRLALAYITYQVIGSVLLAKWVVGRFNDTDEMWSDALDALDALAKRVELLEVAS